MLLSAPVHRKKGGNNVKETGNTINDSYTYKMKSSCDKVQITVDSCYLCPFG